MITLLHTLIFDFDAVYKEQNFYERYEKDVIWRDMEQMTGVNAYCSKEAQLKIEDTLQRISLPTISYLDSGNYHYMTLFFLKKITVDFTLVLLDYHSDMQDGLCSSMLSCGNWVQFAIRQLPHLKQVVFLGVAQNSVLSRQIISNCEVCIISEEMMKAYDWLSIFSACIKYPIYLSIDKDVMSREYVETNWNQGSMTGEQLEEFLEYLQGRYQVLGIDTCGEYPVNYSDLGYQRLQDKNNGINTMILQAGYDCLIA